MAGIAPPHVTLVYPEETVDERSLLVRVSETCERFGPIRIRIEEFAADNAGEGGVYALVGDPTGCLEALRDELLLPPQRSLSFPFHTTVCHPRTSAQGRSCWEALDGGSAGIDATVSDVVFSTTDNVTRKVIQRLALAGPRDVARESIAAAVVFRGDQVLLGHRCPSRKNFPGTWDVIGGHVEIGESPRTAVRRELMEEIGIEASLGGAWRLVVDDELGIEMMFWLVRDWKGDIVNCAPYEYEELRWFRRSEFHDLKLPHPSYVELLDSAFEAAQLSL